MFVQLGLVLLLSCGLLGESDTFGGDTRIVGGRDAPENVAVYQVSIRRHNSNQEWHSCGGSIIHEEWVLTAAHCTYSINADALTIVVGTTQLQSGGDRYKIKKIINHENFAKHNLRNDIALLKVDGKIQMKRNVRAIRLKKQPVATGSTCALTGWGKLHKHGSSPNKLQVLIFNSISNEDCNKQFKGSNMLPIDDKQLCVRAPSNKGACNGDSGGPLVAFDGKKGLVQVGVASWGIPCGKNYPDVFASISGYYDWITNHMKD